MTSGWFAFVWLREIYIYMCVLEEILREHFLILHYYRIGWSMFFPRPPRSEENFPLAINKRTIRQSGWAVITCAMNNERDGKKADFCGMLKRESLDNGGASRRRGTETKKKRKKQQNSYRLVGEHRFIADIISSENRINVYILMGGNVSIKFRLRSRVWNSKLNFEPRKWFRRSNWLNIHTFSNERVEW